MMMKEVYFIDVIAAEQGVISGLKDKLNPADEVHIFGANVPKTKKEEISAISKNSVLHISPITIRQRVDFELVTLYAMYAAANTCRQLHVISNSQQVLQTVEEYKMQLCN